MPPNLVAATVRQGLFTRIVGRRLLYYPELSSTMDEAAKLGEGDAEEGAVVVAEVQNAGRGRQGRSWVSQPGNLLVSVLFRPTIEALPFISIIGGIAAARAVRKVTGLDPKIKWPNDLLIGGRKAAGILAESAIVGDSVWYAVLGVGMNVSLNTEESEELSSFATSVNAAAAPTPVPPPVMITTQSLTFMNSTPSCSYKIRGIIGSPCSHSHKFRISILRLQKA